MLLEQAEAFDGGGIHVLGAGVPAQPFARQVGVEPFQRGERTGLVPDHPSRPVPGPRAGGATRAGGRAARGPGARHQPIVDTPTDTSTPVPGGVTAWRYGTQQALQLRLVDELVIDLAPLLLGHGIWLFGTGAPLRLEDPEIVAGRRVTHLRYRVGK